MSLHLSSRQWKALAAVYHLYADIEKNEDSSSATITGGKKINGDGEICKRQREDDDDNDEKASLQWVQGVLPLLLRAFPNDSLVKLNDSVKQKRCAEDDNREINRSLDRKRQRTDHRNNEIKQWRMLIPSPMDAFFTSVLSSGEESSLLLTRNELVLLRLLNKEQCWSDCCYQQCASLQEEMRQTGERLLQFAVLNDRKFLHNNTITSMSTSSKKEKEHHQTLSLKTTEENDINGNNKNNEQSHNFYKRRKNQQNTVVNLLDDEEATDEEEESSQPLDTTQNKTLPNKSNKQHLSASASSTAISATVDMHTVPITSEAESMFDLICVQCGAEGGDLFRCNKCKKLRHEACGGPRVDSSTGVCNDCCALLGLSPSSCSLRSSTSTEERAELGEDNSDASEDEDTSLSGFIVRSSQESESTAAETSLSSSSSSSSSESVLEEKVPSKKRARRRRR